MKRKKYQYIVAACARRSSHFARVINAATGMEFQRRRVTVLPIADGRQFLTEAEARAVKRYEEMKPGRNVKYKVFRVERVL